MTLFLLWPLLLACVMVSSYWDNLLSVGAYTLIVLLTCLNTALLALFCSVVFRKTSISLMTTYLLIIVLFCAPLATIFFSQHVLRPNRSVARFRRGRVGHQPVCGGVRVPLDMDLERRGLTIAKRFRSWRIVRRLRAVHRRC